MCGTSARTDTIRIAQQRIKLLIIVAALMRLRLHGFALLLVIIVAACRALGALYAVLILRCRELFTLKFLARLNTFIRRAVAAARQVQAQQASHDKIKGVARALTDC